MKPIHLISDSYTKYNEDYNEKDPKFKVVDHIKRSEYKNIVAKDILQIGQKKVSLLVKLKIQFRGLMLLLT